MRVQFSVQRLSYSFILGYACMALKHTFKIDKVATALLTGALCSVLFVYVAHTVIPQINGQTICHLLMTVLKNTLYT
jgi:hypothetical protein